MERRLAAILAADVAGYSRLMGQDEAGTLARLRTHRRELIDPKIGEHKGRIVKTTGDGILIEFQSVVEAVACAVAVQRGMGERNISTPEHERIVFRVGVNLGDIIIADDNDIHGDGVNVAARLEALAEPGGICVSRVVRDQVRDKLDLTFDDLGNRELKNIARPLRVYRVRAATAETAPITSPIEISPVLVLPDKPSIAVLPFQNMSGGPEQEYFVDGMVEEIITALSRIRWLFVIAHNSSFTYKGQGVDVKQVGRELGVRYVLEGSVRKGGNRVRIAGQLIDATSGAHLWADHFDGLIEDVFELQDKVALNVAGVIEPALQAAETTRSAGRPTADLTADDLYLRARREWLGGFDVASARADIAEFAALWHVDSQLVNVGAEKARMQALKDWYLKDDPHMAVEQVENGYRLIERNCPYINTAMSRPSLCSVSVNALTKALGVRVEREEKFQNGDGRCVFRIHADEPVDEKTEFRLESEM